MARKLSFFIFTPSEPLRSLSFSFLLLPSDSEAPLFHFYSFRVTQKLHFSIFTPYEWLRSCTFSFLLLPSDSEALLFYFYSFRVTQKLHFSISTHFEWLRSSTFLFLLLPSDSEALLFYFYSFRVARILWIGRKYDIFSCKIFAYYQIIPTFAVRIEERKQMRTFTVNTNWWWRLVQLK